MNTLNKKYEKYGYWYNLGTKNILKEYKHRFIAKIDWKLYLIPIDKQVQHVARIEYFKIERSLQKNWKEILTEWVLKVII